MTTELSPLTQDWLDALIVLQRARGHSLAWFARTWKPELHSRSHYLLSFRETGEEVSVIEIHSPGFAALPKIERVEILLFAAYCAQTKAYRAESDPKIDMEEVESLGCHWKNTPDIRERWRLMDWRTPLHLQPLASFEDRPRCGICSMPVPTDAGAWVVSKGLSRHPWKVRQSEENPGETEVYCPAAHEECMRYTHRMLRP